VTQHRFNEVLQCTLIVLLNLNCVRFVHQGMCAVHNTTDRILGRAQAVESIARINEELLLSCEDAASAFRSGLT
jgi:hypothetical protein